MITPPTTIRSSAPVASTEDNPAISIVPPPAASTPTTTKGQRKASAMHAISSTPSPADVKEPACTFAFVHEYYSAGEHASGHAAWKPTNICANVQRSRANPVGRSRTALSLLNTFRQGEKIDLTSLQITQLSWTTLSTRDAPNWTSSRAQARKVVETCSLLDMDTSTTDPHLPEATTGSSWVHRISSSDSRSASYVPMRAYMLIYTSF
jgi:hypothetical protein